MTCNLYEVTHSTLKSGIKRGILRPERTQQSFSCQLFQRDGIDTFDCPLIFVLLPNSKYISQPPVSSSEPIVITLNLLYLKYTVWSKRVHVLEVGIPVYRIISPIFSLAEQGQRHSRGVQQRVRQLALFTDRLVLINHKPNKSVSALAEVFAIAHRSVGYRMQEFGGHARKPNNSSPHGNACVRPRRSGSPFFVPATGRSS